MSRQLYEVVAGPLPTTLTASFTYGTDTSIMVLDATDIPEAPNIITISDVDDYFITVEYLTKNDTELTDLTFIEGFEEHEFSIGSEVVRAVAKYDFDALKDAIDEAHTFDIVIEGEVLPKVDDKVTLPPARDGHLGLVKPGDNIIISPDGTISASSEVSIDYTIASNKPQINSVELIGDKSSSDLGLAGANDLQLHISDVDNPHSVTKDQVGLGEVDNTSDLDKPVSTATQSALDEKVDKETGKVLSTNDFTDAYKQKVDDTSDDLSVHIEDIENPHEVTKEQVGLGNVDNTSDSDKPISTAVGAALAQKADSSTVTDHIADVTNPHEVTKAQVGLGNVDNTSDANKPISTAAQTALNGKVDKVNGKELSSNDYTDADKEALEGAVSDIAEHIADTTNPHEVTATQIGVEEGAEVNVLEGIKIAGVDAPISSKKSNIPPATTSAPGVVIVGSNLTVDANGRISAVVEGAAQSDWSETDPTSPAFIKEKPELGTASALDVPVSGNASASQVVKGSDSRLTDTRTPKSHASTHYGTGADAIPEATQTTNGLMSSADKTKLNGIEAQAQKNVQSDWNAVSGDKFISNKPEALSEFSNDENFQTDTQVAASISTHNSSTTAHADIRGLISSEVSRAEGEEQSLQDQIDALTSRTDVVDVVGTKAALLAYDTSKLLTNDIVKVLVDESQSNAISYYRWVITAGTGAWNYVGSQGPFYTKSEADGYFVPQQRTVNGQALTGNVTLDADDVGALPDDATLSDLPGDATHRTVTDAEKTAWNAKQSALTFDSTPTASSTNPVTSGGVYSALSGKADDTDLQAHIDDEENPHGVTAAQVGLGNVDNTSDADKPISDATATALAGKVDKVEGKGLSDANYTTAEKTKLAGIESGAQANVQPDWEATSGMQAIANKPELGTAAAKNVPATGDATSSQVVLGSDSRLTNPRTPASHASSHASGGTDAITPSAIGAAPTSHRSTSTTYGAASNAYYGHAKASSTIPKDLGATANTGTELDSYARGDHIHRNPITISTSDPSGGVSGDVWLKYTP